VLDRRTKPPALSKRRGSSCTRRRGTGLSSNLSSGAAAAAQIVPSGKGGRRAKATSRLEITSFALKSKPSRAYFSTASAFV